MWSLASFGASFQRRVVRFLLKRAIGQFLLREIDLEDLDVQISKGHVALRNLELNVDVCIQAWNTFILSDLS